MTNYREIVRLKEQGLSQRQIAIACKCSRNTVANVLSHASTAGLDWEKCEQLSNLDIEQLLFLHKEASSIRKMPDYEYIHLEMAKDGVTLSLLWDEYRNQCRLNNNYPLMYTQFCLYYRQFAVTNKATMHIHRKPGERIEVDWSGTKAHITDRHTGEIIDLQLFVGVLSSSQYAYAEAFDSQNMANWIDAHNNMFSYFGGSTRILTPDNLKTGVEKVEWHDVKLNQTYQELAEHYNTAIIPARVRHPKDKPSAESSVNVAATWIVAALRHSTFFSLRELNEAIQEKLQILNEKPFQKRPGSRYSVFIDEEKSKLIPLPATRYELATWRVATVLFNYHIKCKASHLICNAKLGEM